MESIFSWVIAIAGLGWLGLIAACVALLRRGRPLPAATEPQELSASDKPTPGGLHGVAAQPPIVFATNGVDDEDVETHFYCPEPTEHLDQTTLEALMLAVAPDEAGVAEPDATTQPTEYPMAASVHAGDAERVEASLNPRALLDGGGPISAFSRRRALMNTAPAAPKVPMRSSIH